LTSASLAENAGTDPYPGGHLADLGQHTDDDKGCDKDDRKGLMEDHLRGTHTTLTTSLLSPTPTSLSSDAIESLQAVFSSPQTTYTPPWQTLSDDLRVQRNDSTVNGVVIGLLSSFGSAILIALIFLIVYFFKYTSSGRILLDRLGRPGEFDDEQAYAREEAEALEEMDDLQRTEYLRAKGTFTSPFIVHNSEVKQVLI
jgi:hypothetical protein